MRARVSAVYRGIRDSLSAPVLDGITLAAQIQELIQLPVLIAGDIEVRLETYADFIRKSLYSINITEAFDFDRDAAGTHELFLTAALTAVAQIAVSGLFANRVTAIEAAVAISDQFILVTNDLDDIQELFLGNFMGGQYFSQESSFGSIWLLTGQAVNYIFRTSFDLAIERRFVLKQPRAPIEITITEYGELGDADINFYNFVDYNKLHGEEILILPAGREVVVYI